MSNNTSAHVLPSLHTGGFVTTCTTLCMSCLDLFPAQRTPSRSAPRHGITSKQQTGTELFKCLSSSFPSSHSHMILSLEMKHESVGNHSQLDDCISCQPKYQDCVNTQILFTNQAVRKLGSERRHLCVFCASSSHNRLPEMASFFS